MPTDEYEAIKMFKRRKQIGLAVCLLISLVAVCHNVRYIFYSVLPVRVQSKSLLSNSSSQADDSTGTDHFSYHGQSQVHQSTVHEPTRQLTLFVSSQPNATLNQSAAKRLTPNETHPWSRHVTRSSNQEQRPVVDIENIKTPLNVLLLSYQRSGSSIISSLFGDNRHIFFLYEPLDSIYTALYGLSPGWTVPADLSINKNGTLRKMPALEKDSVTSFLQNIYDCEFDGVPTEFFIHPFWWYFSNWTERTKPYASCLRAYGLTDRSLSVVQRSISVYCGRRFGDVRSGQEKCYGKLWPNYGGRDGDSAAGVGGRSLTRTVHSRFYTSSLRQMKKKCSFCVNKYLKAPCKQSRFRAVKTVRGTMDEAEVLLERDPKFKVIHLLRDPRGVTRSRMKATWSRGFYDVQKDELVAHAYCETALRDFRTLNRLKEKFPGRIVHILLEDFFEAPEAKLAELSGFLGIRFGADALHRIYKRMKPGFVDKWRTELSPELVTKINKQCEHFMAALHIQV